jgi:homocysteine S-methyltransferase
MGCRGDAYDPTVALDADSALRFHREQAEALALAGADFLMAPTMPAFSEALGIARAMASTGYPYVLSFVLRANGTLLDGVPVAEAIDRIDNEVDPAPTAYLANCVHPDNLLLALGAAEFTVPGVCNRLVGLQGNTSRKTPEELDNSPQLETDDPEAFARAVVSVMRNQELAQRLAESARDLVRTRYGWDRVADKMDEVIQSVVDTKGVDRCAKRVTKRLTV